MGNCLRTPQPKIIAPAVVEDLFCNGVHAVELVENSCVRFILYRDCIPVLGEAEPGTRVHLRNVIFPLSAIWPAIDLTTRTLGRDMLIAAARNGFKFLC